jgi:hypothetical protein
MDFENIYKMAEQKRDHYDVLVSNVDAVDIFENAAREAAETMGKHEEFNKLDDRDKTNLSIALTEVLLDWLEGNRDLA